MTTHYLPAGHGASFPAGHVSHYRGAAALVQAITAAAALAPESAPVIPRAFPDGAYDAPHNSRVWISADGNGSGYWQEWHGPVMPDPGPDPDYMPRVAFHYTDANGTRGAMTLRNLRASLTAAADRVHKARAAFDGKVKRVTHKRAAPSSAPHAAARALWQAREYSDALALAENVGALFFGRANKDGVPRPYMSAQHIDAAGHGFTIARSIETGRFRVLHTSTAASVDSADIFKVSAQGFTHASDALAWVETESQCEAWRAKLNAAAAKLAPFDQAQARAHYLGADAPSDDGAETAQDAAQAREPAADAPMVQAPAADALAAVSDPSAAVSDAIGAALLARYGIADPAACAHLPGFAAEFVRIRAECGAPAANDAAPVDPGPDAPAPAATPTRRASGPDAATIAGLMATYAAAIAPVCTPGYAFPGAAACPPATHSQAAPDTIPRATHSLAVRKPDPAALAELMATFQAAIAPVVAPPVTQSDTAGGRQFNVIVGRKPGPAAGQRGIVYPLANGPAALRNMETLARRGFESITRTTANGITEDCALADMRAIFGDEEPAPLPGDSQAAPRPPARQFEAPAKRQRAKRPAAHYAIFDRHGAMVSWVLGIAGRNRLMERIDAWSNHPDAPHTVRRALPGECAAFSDARRAQAIAAETDRARQLVPIHAARYCRPGPPLRIPAGDPRLRIPARFAPVYLLQGAAQ